jgi:hypothetical protein
MIGAETESRHSDGDFFSEQFGQLDAGHSGTVILIGTKHDGQARKPTQSFLLRRYRAK